MIARREKCEATSLGAKNEPDGETCTALEIVSLKTSNAQTGMKMRFPKSIADCVDCSRHFAPARFRELPNIPPERF